MTGADLTYLRWAWCLDSAVRMAARLGCHPCTIRRNQRRPQITQYLADLVEAHPTCQRFCDGLQWGRDDREFSR